jgi:hypothetical protein
MLDEHAVSADPGINHRDVDSAGQSFSTIHTFQRFVAFCYIANEDVSLASELANPRRHACEGVLSTGHENDPRALASRVLRDGATNAGRSSGNQDGATPQGA